MEQQKNKYISKYSNDKLVSAAQYITELICERKAVKDKKDLHYRFWLSPEWEKYFKNQIGSANKLLKTYADKAIVNALLTPKGKTIYSLRAPHLIAIIEQEEKKLQAQNKQFTKEVERKNKISYTKNNTKKGIISKLKDIE
mgnify:CR=1 FL=1|tara:strand:- start:132 stop:554 length:423 start_codon:yes stop_codon:yes gene_type:complete